MHAPNNLRIVRTSHCSIVVEDSGGDGLPVVLIHGNSSCRNIFRHQLEAPLARGRRFLAIDLPGHGSSSDALDPDRTYTRTGMGDAIAELLDVMAIMDPVVVGWSFGGHVAIELLAHLGAIRGLMLTGTPPVPRGGMSEGFRSSPHTAAAGRASLSDEEVAAFATAMAGDPVPPFLHEAIQRTDGRFRETLFAVARVGSGADQRLAVERSTVPIAIVNGADDPLIRLDYLDGVAYGNLWDGRCHRLPGAGHAPFWQSPEAFNAILARFLSDLA